MTPVQREARTFLSQFHLRPFTVSDLEKALQAQGFSLVEYSRVSNGKEVTTLLTSLRLFDYAARQSAFTYQDPHLRIVFMLENLSQQEQMILLRHELGHILCRHLEQSHATGPGSSVLQEQEANEFASILLRYNRRCRPRRIALWGGISLAAAAALVVLVFHNSLAQSMMRGGLALLERLHLLRRKARRHERLESAMEKYRETAAYFKTHRLVVFNVLGITFAQNPAAATTSRTANTSSVRTTPSP